MGVFSNDYIPNGARFGPLRGESQAPVQSTVSPIEAPTASTLVGGAEAKSSAKQKLPIRWKIFSSGSQVIRLIDTSNKQRSNWMTSVRMARTQDSQNLVACQVSPSFQVNIEFN